MRTMSLKKLLKQPPEQTQRQLHAMRGIGCPDQRAQLRTKLLARAMDIHEQRGFKRTRYTGHIPQRLRRP